MKKLFVMLLAGLTFSAKAQDASIKKTTTIQHFRIALQGGFSQLLAKTPENVAPQNRDYESALKSGANYGLDAIYFISNDWGLGVKFNQFKSSHSGLFYEIPNGASGTTVAATDNITHSFVGPSLSTKYVSANTKHTFVLAVALGYLGYVNDGGLNGIPLKMTGGTFGSTLDAGYDFNITKSFALGAQISIVGGVLKSYTVSNGAMSTKVNLDDKNKMSLARLDISFGARFNF